MFFDFSPSTAPNLAQKGGCVMRRIYLSQVEVDRIMREVNAELYYSKVSNTVENNVMLLLFRDEFTKKIDFIYYPGVSSRC